LDGRADIDGATPERACPDHPDFGGLSIQLDILPIIRNNAADDGQDIEFLNMQYFVVMIDYGRRGREAIVDPEMTRREVVARVASGEYTNISFIHEIADTSVEDITGDILAEATSPPEVGLTGADLQATTFDHTRDLRKHEPA
jgi:hypothetical protein